MSLRQTVVWRVRLGEEGRLNSSCAVDRIEAAKMFSLDPANLGRNFRSARAVWWTTKRGIPCRKAMNEQSDLVTFQAAFATQVHLAAGDHELGLPRAVIGLGILAIRYAEV